MRGNKITALVVVAVFVLLSLGVYRAGASGGTAWVETLADLQSAIADQDVTLIELATPLDLPKSLIIKRQDKMLTVRGVVDDAGFYGGQVFAIGNVTLENITLRAKNEASFPSANTALLQVTGNVTLRNVQAHVLPRTLQGQGMHAVGVVTMTKLTIEGGSFTGAAPGHVAAWAGSALYVSGGFVQVSNASLYGGEGAPAVQLIGGEHEFTQTILTTRAYSALTGKSGAKVALDGCTLNIQAQDNIPAMGNVDNTASFIFIGSHTSATLPLYNGDDGNLSGIAREIYLSMPETAYAGDMIPLEVAFDLPAVSFSQHSLFSDNSQVARVEPDDSLIGVGPGTAHITATLYNGKTAHATVEIKEKPATPVPTAVPTPTPLPGGTPTPIPTVLPTATPMPTASVRPTSTPPFSWIDPNYREPDVIVPAPWRIYAFAQQKTAIRQGPYSGAKVLAYSSGEGFVRLIGMEDSWAKIYWEDGEGYVLFSSLNVYEIPRDAGYSASFTRSQSLYKAPAAAFAGTAYPGQMTKVLLTRGEWTAIVYKDELAFTAARGVHLLAIASNPLQVAGQEPQVLYASPSFEASTVARLFPGVWVESVSIIDESAGWYFVKIGAYAGYLPNHSIVNNTE